MGVLDVIDLAKSFLTPNGERAVVIDVPHFSIEPGQQLALEGSSGSGKTTLLNLIAGILLPDAGRILLDGQDIAAAGEARRDRLRAAKVGYIFQTFNLLQGFTALENVELGMMFGRGIDAHAARELLRRVGLADRLHYRPRQLSVGQQQRVAVARALANHPRLVLADEPTGNLDRRHAHDALMLIREICRENGAALLLVSHDPAVLAEFETVHALASINRAAAATPTGGAAPQPACGSASATPGGAS